MITKAAVLFKKNDVRIVNLKLPLLKESQVLVKIKYTSICHTQLQEIFGLRGKDKYLPHCLGHEATGIVKNIGKNVKKVKINDKVCLTWVPSEGKGSKNTQYTLQTSGEMINAGPVNTFSEYSIISENKLIKLKKSTNLKKAVLLGCAVPTAFNCFVNSLENANKNNMLILGAGGLGLSSLHAAKKLKFKNIYVLDQNKKKLEIAKKLGADFIIRTNKGNLNNKLRSLENLFFNVVECTGNLNILNSSIKCAKIFGGRYIVIGNYPNRSKININTWEIIMGRILSGAWLDNKTYEQNLKKFLKLFKDFKADVFFGNKIYKLERINNAISDFRKGKVIRPLIKLF